MEGFKEAIVTRENGQMKITYQGENLGNVKVYRSLSPDFSEAEGQLVAESDNGVLEIPFADGENRPYFLLVADNGARIRTAERVLQFEGMVNFRDLGGYLTTDGYRTKWGKLLRSAAHDTITDRDVVYLKNIGLKTVVDYRSSTEVADNPDRQVEGITYHNLRPLEEAGATNILNVKMTNEADAISALKGINRTLATSAQANSVYAQLVRLVLDESNLPLVQHCTAGKDRVGVGSATLLLALGVPEETILNDYLLSNDNQVKEDKLKQGKFSNGQLSEEILKMFKALAMVRKEYLQAFFDEIKVKFGTAENYLKQGLGLTDAELAQMREMFLEKM